MRLLIVILAALCAPVYAQDRIFRASLIDIEQNERLDALESRILALEAPASPPLMIETFPATKQLQLDTLPAIKQMPAITQLPVECPECPECPDCPTAEITDTELPGHILPQVCPGGVCPVITVRRVPAQTTHSHAGSTHTHASPAAPAVSNNYRRRWFNNDGLSLRQHAEQMHGHNTAGLTNAQVAYLNDRDHDSWGHGGHPSAGQAGYPVARGAVVGSARGLGRVARVATAPLRRVLSGIRGRMQARRASRQAARSMRLRGRGC